MQAGFKPWYGAGGWRGKLFRIRKLILRAGQRAGGGDLALPGRPIPDFYVAYRMAAGRSYGKSHLLRERNLLLKIEKWLDLEGSYRKTPCFTCRLCLCKKKLCVCKSLL